MKAPSISIQVVSESSAFFIIGEKLFAAPLIEPDEIHESDFVLGDVGADWSEAEIVEPALFGPCRRAFLDNVRITLEMLALMNIASDAEMLASPGPLNSTVVLTPDRDAWLG